MIAKRILEKLSPSEVLVGKYFTLKNGRRIVVVKCEGPNVIASQVVNGRPLPNNLVSIPIEKFNSIVLT